MTLLGRCGTLVTLIASLTVVATGAHADVTKCRRSIAKESAKFLASRSKALQKCEDKKRTGALAPGSICRTEPTAAVAIAKATTKAKSGITKTCCGPDRSCGNGNDESLAAIGWGNTAMCPNFENGQSGNCSNPINHPGDVADCVLCVGAAATDQLVDLLYAQMNDAANSAIERCQRTIGRETVKFFQAKSKALAKCWDGRITGKHGNDCPDPGDGGKALAAIAKAESKKVAAICNACGGFDGCGGSPDLNPQSDVGFADSCPNLTVPNDGGPHAGESCARPVTTMSDLVACVDCIAEFKVDCVDDLTVLSYESYSPNCNANIVQPTRTVTPTPTVTPTQTGGPPPTATATPTGGPTPTATITPGSNCGNGTIDPGEECDPTAPVGSGESCHPSTCVPPGLPIGQGEEFKCTCADGQQTTIYNNGELDNGWTGTSQNTATVDGTDADTLLFDCNGTSDPLCRLAGPRPGRWGFRCQNDTSHHCNVDADCAPTNGRCVAFLGPPLPLSSGGVPVCVTSFFDKPIVGTLNVSDGSTESFSLLRSIVHLSSSISTPCANCNCTGIGCQNAIGTAGTCSVGPAIGQACTIEGLSKFGPVSRDCPPVSSTNISGSGLDIRFFPTTTGQSTLDANLPCTAAGFEQYDCPCDTCGGGPTPDAPCKNDAQCGAGGVCGATRCGTGSNNVGALCTTDADCPPGAAGTCARPGLATKPNSCSLGCDGGSNNNLACTTNANCPSGECVPLCRQIAGEQIGSGQCTLGPSDGHCSTEDFRGCTTNLDCSPPPLGTCATCALGQVCQFNLRPCHVFPMQLQGNAQPFSNGTSNGLSVNSFCIPDTQSPAVNQTAGLPGEGSIVTDHSITFAFPAQP
jgi:hypothetical protein